MKFLIQFLSIVLFSVASTAWAVPQPPAEVAGAQQSGLQIVQAIVENAKGLDNSSDKLGFLTHTQFLEGQVDFQQLASQALGEHASSLSAVQKNDVALLLKGIITKTVYPKAPGFFKDVTIQYAEEKQTDKGLHIASVIAKQSRRSSVDFWLGQNKKVWDLAVDGESWVDNLKMQFDEVITRKGAKELIARMRKRLKDLDSESRSTNKKG